MRKQVPTVRVIVILSVIIAIATGAYYHINSYRLYRGYEPEAGDIVFQSLSSSLLIKTIMGVTESKISHCGIVLKKNNEWYVLEALGPVRETELNEWIRQGIGNKFAAFRLKSEFRNSIPEMICEAYKLLGKPYDSRYRFDDDKIYCSELIFKAYKRVTGENIGEIVKLGDLNWQPYEEAIRQFWKGPVPIDREMITPKHLSEAKQLVRVFTNGF